MKNKIILLLLIVCSIHVNIYAIEDTQENRIQEAKRYLTAMPAENIFNDLLQNMAKNRPEDEREQFIEFMSSILDVKTLNEIMLNSMVKHFSADELKALADFYGSPIGKSAMQKFGIYMADVMPTIQEHVLKASGKYLEKKSQLDNKNKIRIKCILVKMKEDAEYIIEKLKAGTEFSELAKHYSLGPQKEKGGDMGFINPNDMIDELGVAAKDLKLNEYSDIIETTMGYYILFRAE